MISNATAGEERGAYHLKFMITYILQYEIPLRVKFSNLGHDLIDISSNMD